jgi:hypothetical protein
MRLISPPPQSSPLKGEEMREVYSCLKVFMLWNIPLKGEEIMLGNSHRNDKETV